MISKEQAITHLTEGFKRLDIELPSLETLDLIWQYFTELAKWSAKINLVAKGPELELLENHFLDCFTMVPIVQKYLDEDNSHNLLDIGSGAGFPGLIIKIACPHLPVTLVEPRLKRTTFLRHIVRSLQLKDITILEERIDKDDNQFAKKYGHFSLITCRALTKIKTFTAMTCHIASPKAKIIFMKGPKAEEELQDWQAQADDCFELDSLSTLTLPFSGADRSIVVFSKTNKKL